MLIGAANLDMLHAQTHEPPFCFLDALLSFTSMHVACCLQMFLAKVKEDMQLYGNGVTGVPFYVVSHVHALDGYTGAIMMCSFSGAAWQYMLAT